MERSKLTLLYFGKGLAKGKEFNSIKVKYLPSLLHKMLQRAFIVINPDQYWTEGLCGCRAPWELHFLV